MQLINYLDLLKFNNSEYIDFEKSIYSKSTLLKSCYKFTDKAYIYLKSINENNKEVFRVFFEYKNKVEKNLIGEYMNELLDQELRDIVSTETKKIRETIVTKALLSSQSNAN